jgi:hypothetical protein
VLPQLKVILNTADVSAGSIGDLIDYSVDKMAERGDKTSLSRLARNADRTEPESMKTGRLALQIDTQKTGHTAE